MVGLFRGFPVTDVLALVRCPCRYGATSPGRTVQILLLEEAGAEGARVLSF